MPLFAYRVRTTSGETTRGTIDAPDQTTAINKLRGQKVIVLEINLAKKNPFEMLNKYNPLRPRVKAKDLVLFSRQLSTLVSAGVPIVQGLTILTEQIENPAFKKVVDEIAEDIKAGISIAEAMKKQPEAFSELYVAMIRAGEVGGILDVILERLSAYLEAADALKGKVKGALMYPSIVAVIAASVTVFLLVVVIPTFQEIFSSFGADLPLPTKILIAISNLLKRYIILLILGVIGIAVAFVQYYKTEKGKFQIDAISLKVPLFGEMLRKVAVAKFTRTLGTLVKSGVPILQALDTVAQTAGNKIIERAILQAKESIREGEKIADPLRKSQVFPPMVIQMISVGEETGNLDTMLNKIADFYDQEVDVAVKGLTSMIEPIVICVMGIVIGAIVIAMFMPMFSMGALAGKAG
ncbi:MAG: type II secretion system F family protein [Elusimicrobia bacterium]|nr:type II secretion system F family protein [Elusimicrobiota bacterium]